jgi:hypothetical protein
MAPRLVLQLKDEGVAGIPVGASELRLVKGVRMRAGREGATPLHGDFHPVHFMRKDEPAQPEERLQATPCCARRCSFAQKKSLAARARILLASATCRSSERVSTPFASMK